MQGAGTRIASIWAINRGKRANHEREMQRFRSWSPALRGADWVIITLLEWGNMGVFLIAIVESSLRNCSVRFAVGRFCDTAWIMSMTRDMMIKTTEMSCGREEVDEEKKNGEE